MNKTEFLATFIENNKQDLPKNSNGSVNKAAAARILDGVFDTVTEVLASGDDVSIVGFGSFSTVERVEKSGRNPQTNEPITIPAHVSPKFKPGSALKNAVNK